MSLLLMQIMAVVILLCFAHSMFKTMGLITLEDRLFPRWLLWFMAVPVIGLAFQWLMIPFGLPKSLKAHWPNNEVILAKSDKLFKIGLAYVIVTTAGAFLSALAFIPMLILLVIYWLEMPKLRELIQPCFVQQSTPRSEQAPESSQ